MKTFDKSISETIELLGSGQLKCEDLIKAYINNLQDKDPENIFKSIFKEDSIRKAKEIDEKKEKGLKLGKLAGIPLVITHDISTKGILTTAGSKMLENYIPPFNASIIEDLLKEDAIILGKLKIQEFNLERINYEKDIIDFLPLIIGSEVKAHILSLKASYGLISRYGLISATSSLGGICISGKHMEDLAMVLSVIAGYDEKDSTSARFEKIKYSQELKTNMANISIYTPKELSYNKDQKLGRWMDKLRELGVQTKEVNLKNIKYSSLAYKILASAEFASNTGRYDGIGFGYRTNDYENRDELYKKSRSEAFGMETKKTIMIGNYVISSDRYDKYYKKSQQIRRVIKEEIDTILGESGFLIIPMTDSLDKKTRANYETLGNMTGYPLITIKYKDDKNKEVELLILSTSFKEEDLLQLGYIIEGEILRGGGN